MQRVPSMRTLLATAGAVLIVSLSAMALATDVVGATSDDAAGEPIDINTATEQQLTQLPGVGAVTAKRIVEFREEHGPFLRVEDLMKVKGIGEKSFQKLRPRVKVAGKAPSASAKH